MKTLKVLVAILVIALIAAFASGMINFEATEDLYATDPSDDQVLISENQHSKGLEEATDRYEIGDEATDFNLKNIDGEMVSLSDYPNAKGFVVIFTCNHCPYSKAYEDRIIAIDKKYKYSGYPVIAINPNNPRDYPEDSYENMKKRAAEKGFTFPYLVDAGQKIYPKYGATKTPHVYLLEKEGDENIVKYIGAIDDNHKDANNVKNKFLEDAIKALMDGREIAVKETLTIGCRIK
jgi:peroxiredoxin